MEANRKNVLEIVETGQCVGCGLCTAVCPRNCIELKKRKGMYQPDIDEEKCIKCGLCNRVCPGKQFDYNREYKSSSEPKNFWIGNYIHILSMQTQNREILRSATSGGVVTQIVKNLLDKGEYDCAFLVNTHNFKHLVSTEIFEKTDDILKSTKSRYIPVAQNKAVAYALKHREKRIIFVGTSCAVHGIINVIRELTLNRDNYLILGLFCDRTMHYGIYDYFNQHPKCDGKLSELVFRTKESGGWPGKMRFILSNGESVDLKASERMLVKDYFQMERCLYCLDKLNQFADISIGDDYAVDKNDKYGRSAVIIRNHKAERIIESMKGCFHSFAISEEALVKAQKLYMRQKNLCFIFCKKLKVYVPQKVIKVIEEQNKDFEVEYQDRISKIKIGEQCSYKTIRSKIPTKKKIQYWIMDTMRFIPVVWRIKYFIRRIKK